MNNRIGKILVIRCTLLFGLVLGTINLIGCQQQTAKILTPVVLDMASSSITVTSPAGISNPLAGTTAIPVTTTSSQLFSGVIATPSTATVRMMMLEVNRDRALRELRQLTGEEPICIRKGCFTIKNRETGSEGLRWAKDYVYEELFRLAYNVEVVDWSHSGYSDQNVIAKKPGVVSPQNEIYFVAHLDGVSPEGADRSPAADDNASGVVALLELARILSDQALDRTVVLLFSTGEEHGVLGTRSYVDDLSPEELAAIRYVVNVEMLSYDSDNDGVMQLWSGDHPPSLAFAHMLSEIISTYSLDLTPHIISGCT